VGGVVVPIGEQSKPRRAYLNMKNREANEILKQHESLIVGMSRREANAIGAASQAEDLAQEGRLELLRIAERFESKNGAALWTYAHLFVLERMRRVARKERKHAANRCDLEDAMRDYRCDKNPESHLLNQESKRLFVVAIMELTDDERTILVKRFDEEKDFRTIAAELGISLGLAHKELGNAVATLKAKAA